MSRFHRWANRLRAGGLYRHGNEHTTGERCAAITGDLRQCGLCSKQAPQTETVDEELLKQGHPRWYCTTRRKTGELVCPIPDRVRMMNYKSAAGYILFLASIPLVLFIIALLNCTGPCSKPW